MKKRVLSLLLCCSMLLCLFPAATAAAAAAAATPAQPTALEIAAPSAILMDAATGTVLYEKNADEKLEPASVTKVMTLLLVMEALESGKIRWDDPVTASDAAAGKGGSQVYLEPGEQMSMDEMLKSVVVASANDCATALAEHVAGSESAFVELMNRRAAELGMTNTHFVNCTGLDDGENAAEHRTTARDIAIMSRELLKHDEIRKYTTIWMDTVRDGKFGLSNTNKLVRFYNGTTGLKTGFTSTAGYCLSASAARDGIELIAVVLHCDTSANRFESAKALLDYGFANYALVNPDLDAPLKAIPVKLGTKASVTPVLTDAAPILIDKGLQAGVTREVAMEKSLEAPVTKGQQLGTLTIRAGDETLAELPIVAGEAVPRLTWWQVTKKLLRKLCMG
jgi:D-alanyl-D-alanine carboxypeptidase (penicillin-binding protein 5/6)